VLGVGYAPSREVNVKKLTPPVDDFTHTGSRDPQLIIMNFGPFGSPADVVNCTNCFFDWLRRFFFCVTLNLLTMRICRKSALNESSLRSGLSLKHGTFFFRLAYLSLEAMELTLLENQ
jgi:hypothetical protein